MPPGNDISNSGSGAIATGGSTAAGAGGIAVGGNVDNLIINQQPITPLLLPTPPAPPAHFTGREAELDRLSQLLIAGENVAITALQGMGGIGKTALAQKLAERLKEKFPGGVLWWSLGPQPDVFTALDVWARHVDPRSDLSAFPDANARANLIRSMLAKLGRLCAIIDDVWDDDSARTLMSAVPPGNPILITTRDGDLAKTLRARVERIYALTTDEAVAMLTRMLGPLGNHEPAAREIANLTEGLPLALELIAGLADSPADLPALAKKLREKPALGVLKMLDGQTREESVEACFTMSYTTLNADMQRRFRALGVFAPAPFDRAALAAVWNDENEETAEQAIRYLTRRNLLVENLAKVLEPSQGSEYHQHVLLCAYALALLEQAGEYHATAARNAGHYRRFAEKQSWRDIERTFEQIDWGWRWVQAHAIDQIIDYVAVVWKFLDIRGRKIEALSWFQSGLTQARAVKDRKNEGALLNNIGSVYGTLGQQQQALNYYQQALDIAREVGDQGGEGTTLNNIGHVYSTLGQQQQALNYYQQALDIAREVGDQGGEGATLNNIGHVYSDLGQQQQALDYYLQALAICREVGDRGGEGVTLSNIGSVYGALGQQQQALDYYLQALAICREVGDRGGEGMTLNNIGSVYDALGRKKRALDHYRQALAIRREVGDRRGEGTTLNNIGLVYKNLGQKQQALEAYQQALAIRREVGDRGGEGTTLNNIGRVYNNLGQKPWALDYYQQALVILREVGDRWNEPGALFNIGMVLDELNRTAEAMTYLEQVVALDEAIGHPNLESDRAKLAEVKQRMNNG